VVDEATREATRDEEPEEQAEGRKTVETRLGMGLAPPERLRVTGTDGKAESMAPKDAPEELLLLASPEHEITEPEEAEAAGR